MGYKFNPFTGNFDIASGSTYSALNLKGTVANAAALPGGAAAGDVYQTEDNDHFYVWDGSAWDDLGDLKGPAGANGTNGSNGTNGKEIELQVGATHIEWRYVGDPTWTNLVALSTITGPQGPAGSNGQNIELQTSATHVQWRVVGASTWNDLIALTAITGPQGPTGATGAQGIPGPGVPTGGTTGQVLTKSSATDYAAQWSTPTGTDLSYTASTRLLESSTGADVTLPLVTSTNAGLAPASGGGTTNFLRADGTWAAPAGGGGGGTPGGSDTQIQFNDGGAFGGDADLTYNKTTNLLTTKGDINLDDGGSFTTTLQVVTPTANRTISLPDATGTVGLVAGSSGQIIYNNAGALAGTTATFDPTNGTRHVLPFGYGSGAGGTVTQATNKSTGVTLNTRCGQVTMNNANLALGTAVTFTLTNSQIAATDILLLNHVSGGTLGNYSFVARCAAGSATISVRNVSGGDLAEAVVIGFAVIKATTA